MKKILLVLLLGLHLFLLVNLQFTAWPEVLSFPYLMSKGFLLYKDAIHVYPPLLDFVLLIIYKIFGFKLLPLQIFTWLLILINDLLIFSLAKKLSGNFKSSFLVLLAYVLLQPILEGNMLWYDTALVTPLLFSLYFYLVKKNYWFVGIALAVAILIKQTAVVFALVFVGYLIYQRINIKRVLLPIIISGGLLLIYLTTTNSLIEFFNWCIYYPSVFWSKFPGYVSFLLTKKDYLILAVIFMPLLAFSRSILKEKLLLIMLFMACLIMVYPRFSYFHLQPALALLVILSSGLRRGLFIGYILVVLLLITLPAARNLWGKEARFYSSTEFKQAAYLDAKVKPDERIYLLGPFSSLYVLSDRIPPKIWTDNFGWYLDIPGVQQNIINSWETNKPQYILWQLPLPGNWYQPGTYQPKLITDWISKNYSKIEKLDNENSLYKLLPE